MRLIRLDLPGKTDRGMWETEITDQKPGKATLPTPSLLRLPTTIYQTCPLAEVAQSSTTRPEHIFYTIYRTKWAIQVQDLNTLLWRYLG